MNSVLWIWLTFLGALLASVGVIWLWLPPNRRAGLTWATYLKSGLLIAVPLHLLLCAFFHLPESDEHFQIRAGFARLRLASKPDALRLNIPYTSSGLQVSKPSSFSTPPCLSRYVHRSGDTLILRSPENHRARDFYRLVEVRADKAQALEITPGAGDVPLRILFRAESLSFTIVANATEPCSWSYESAQGEHEQSIDLTVTLTSENDRRKLIASELVITELQFFRPHSPGLATTTSTIIGGSLRRVTLAERRLTLYPYQRLHAELNSGVLFGVETGADDVLLEGVGSFKSLRTGFNRLNENLIPTWLDYIRFHLREAWIFLGILYVLIAILTRAGLPDFPSVS